MFTIPKKKKIILFDGVCNLCNSAVNTVIDYDKKNIFLFTALQSKTGQEITKKLGIDTNKIDSIILYENSMVYHIKSTAAIKIMNHLGGFWNLTKLLWIFPENLRNYIYDIVAKNRYKWFGKKENCRLPTPELKAKFLD